ncbi:MAG: hypothetical protein U0930_08925 [Pirellulales bacterium]
MQHICSDSFTLIKGRLQIFDVLVGGRAVKQASANVVRSGWYILARSAIELQKYDVAEDALLNLLWS